MVVGQLSGLGAEAEVGNVGDRRGVGLVEAHLPVVLVLVLQLELELLLLEVGQAQLCRDLGVSEPARRASAHLGRLAVVALVVLGVAVAKHGHDIGEDDAGAVVLVRVYKDAQSLKVVRVSKNVARLAALAGDPHGEAITVQLVLARNSEFDFYLPVCCRQGNTREQPAGPGRLVGCESDISAQKSM